MPNGPGKDKKPDEELSDIEQLAALQKMIAKSIWIFLDPLAMMIRKERRAAYKSQKP